MIPTLESASRRDSLEHDNFTLPTIELADLSDKAKVPRTTLGAGRDFDVELGKTAMLRNDVDHVKDIVRSDPDLKGFVDRLETAEAWLKVLEGPEAMEAGAGS